MSIGNIGSVIFTNQMTPAVSAVQTAENNRVDLQNVAAQAAANEKEREVLEVRPAEESHEVDPDRDHERDEADRETQRSEKKEKDDEETDTPTIHKLDIKV